MNWKTVIQKLSTSASVRRAHALLTRIPALGTVVKKFTRTAIPGETRLWRRISAGLGKGLWAYLDPRFEMDYAEGKYEKQVQQALRSNLQPDSVFYDVGAHIGIVSMFAAQLVGKSGSVFAFEADPQNAARIGEHKDRNGLHQIQVVSGAVWSSTGCLRFKRASAQSSRNEGAITQDATVSTENTIDVEAVSLDKFVKGHVSPTLIKIDVEGTEAVVLRGSEEVFARTKPVLICEVHHGKAAEDVTRWLLERDYTFKWLEDSPQFPRHLLAKWGS